MRDICVTNGWYKAGGWGVKGYLLKGSIEAAIEAFAGAEPSIKQVTGVKGIVF
jgi:hypothetical protein